MGYLLAQIFLCLLVAAIFGGILGWLLRGRGAEALGGSVSSVDLDAAQSRVATLEAEISAAQARAVTLEADLAECRASAHAGPAMAGGFVSQALFGEPAEMPVDDLQRISGIGPVIARQLAGIGLTTFRQIADLSADDVERVNGAIEVFQGRIEREKWIAQAARLHDETYGAAS